MKVLVIISIFSACSFAQQNEQNYLGLTLAAVIFILKTNMLPRKDSAASVSRRHFNTSTKVIKSDIHAGSDKVLEYAITFLSR
jgi:hypothetical protein